MFYPKTKSPHQINIDFTGSVVKYCGKKIKSVNKKPTKRTIPCIFGTLFLGGTSGHGRSKIFNFLKIYSPNKANTKANKNRYESLTF